MRQTSQKSKCSKYFLHDLWWSARPVANLALVGNLTKSYSGRKGFTTEGFYYGNLKKPYFGGLELSASPIKLRVYLDV
jgi:hypothetical protein